MFDGPGQIGPHALQGTGYALLAVTSLVVITRFVGSVRRWKDLNAEDYLLLLAYAFFVELSILYIIIAPVISRVLAVESGAIPVYPTIPQDARQLQIFFFITTSSLWLSLWMVKFSLLSIYKRLLNGKEYLIAWWIITIFCGLFLIGCILSSWFSCSSFHAWFSPGACSTPRDQRAAAISLYYAYAVDLVTDFAIMILPIRLIWNLRMRMRQKVSIGGLFCLGFVCIVVATIRVAELGNQGDGGQPSPAWLALWATIEASIAVIIGCCPGLYRFAKATFFPTKQTYPYDSYNLQRPSRRSQLPIGRDISRPFPANGISHSATAWHASTTSSSQEKLADISEVRNFSVVRTAEDRSSDSERAEQFARTNF